MATHGSSVSKPLAEFRVNVSSEDMAIEKASQDGPKPTSSEDYEGITIQSKNEVCAVMPTPVVNEDYRPLFIAAQKGDWKNVKKILDDDQKAMKADVMTGEDGPFTVLDVAIRASQYKLVKNIIKHPSSECKDLEVKLPLAASEGRIKMVKEILEKVDPGSEILQDALRIATIHAPKQKEVIWYLAKCTKSAPSYGVMLLLIRAGHLDIALYLAHQYQGSASPDLLEYLAKMKSNFRSGVRLTFWEKCIDKFIGIPLCLVDTSFDNSTEKKMTRGGTPASKQFKISLSNYATKPALMIKRIGLRHKCCLEFANLVLTEMKDSTKTHENIEHLSKIVFDAASRGISEIVKLCFEHFPELTWNKEFTERLMKNVVKERNVELFRLVNSPSTVPLLTDKMRKELMKTIVEWSSRCQPTDVCGAPFLMQRELQWFKVLDDASDPSSSKSLKIERWFPNGIDPISKSLNWDNFVENRRELLKEAGQWMKETSSSCILVSTLIITVAFAAASTTPGGNDKEGIPNFVAKSSFLVYALADALALFSSVTATLMFLAILTSRYMAEDFLHSLPTKMILGLTFLFLSLAFMLVSFGSAFTIILRDHFQGIYIPITVLAAIPVVLFAILHIPLYFEMIISTYWPRLYRPIKLWE